MEDYTNLKKTLQGMLDKKNADKANEDKIRQEKNDGDRNKILENISGDLSKSLQPVLQDLAKQSKMSTDEVRQAFSQAVQFNLPEVKMPEIKFPEFKIPTPIVNVPAPIVNIPETKFPKYPDFPSEFGLRGIDKKTPLPVMMMDGGGKPMQFPVSMGVGGGRGDFFTIVDIKGSTASLIDQTEGALRVVGSFTASIGSTFATLANADGQITGTNPLPVTFAAAGSQNVNLFDAQASTVTSHQDSSGDFRGLDTTLLRTINTVSGYNSTTATLGSGAAFTGLSEDVKDYATIQVAVFADQVSATDGLSIQQSTDGANWDVTDVYTVPASTGKTFSVQVAARYYRVVYTNGGTIQGAFRIQSVLHQGAPKPSSQRPSDGLSNENDFEQVSAYLAALNTAGTWDRLHTGGFDSLGALRVTQATDSVSSISGTVVVSSVTATLAAANIDSSGVQYSGSNPFPFTIVTSATASLNSALIDSGGVQYSGSNPVPVTLANTGSTQNINMVGGGNDSAFTYMARTTLPTAVADGADVRPKADKLGRLMTRPIQARELIATAYTTISTGTEATILTAAAGQYLDCIWMVFANTSSAAQQIDIRAVSAGNIIHTAYIPAQSTVGWVPPVPWPQDATGNTWTADGADVTNSTVYITSLFSKEV